MLYRELLVPRRAAFTASSSDGGVIEVPTPGKQGFFILKSKAAAVSDSESRVPAPHLAPVK